MPFLIKNHFSTWPILLITAGTAGAIAAYLAGNAAGEGMEGGTLGMAMELHEQAATIALWLTCITAVFYLAVAVFKYKKGWVKFACIILFAVTIAAIARTGYLGGQLVYKHGAGVELALPDFSNPGIDKDE
ncbi:MAG: hypothetical protein IPI88_19445 [Chitinophagaceae bacterium]|nr:hypothetical protein [Chitinophagaceae bacterium]